MRKINAETDSILRIGQQGENMITEVAFPIPADCVGFLPTLYIQRQSDAASYPATHVTSSTNVLWTVSNVDTDVAGYGEAQLRFMDGETCAKTIVYRFYVERSIDSNPGEPPEPYESWIDTMTNVADTAILAKNAAVAAKDEAVGIAESLPAVIAADLAAAKASGMFDGE